MKTSEEILGLIDRLISLHDKKGDESASEKDREMMMSHCGAQCALQILREWITADDAAKEEG